jgi:hypothetical protein
LGQVAWLCGNVYEAAVDMPELLSLARPKRRPGLLGVGSPVRYFAPIAPAAIGASTVDLVAAWRSRRQRHLVVAAVAGLVSAVGLSGYLIRTVNVPLLTGGQLEPAEQERLVARWHRVNAVRVAALAVAMGSTWVRGGRT